MYCPLMGLDVLALNQYGCVHFVTVASRELRDTGGVFGGESDAAGHFQGRTVKSLAPQVCSIGC
jgi:hypothetical protein